MKNAKTSKITFTFKLSYLNSGFALTLGYLNSASSVSSQMMSLFADTLAWTWQIVRTCLHVGGGPQEGEVIHLSM